MQNFYKACCAYAQECIDTEANTKYPTLEELEARCELIQKKCLNDYDDAKQLVVNAVESGAILNLDRYYLTSVFEYLKNLRNIVNNCNPKTRALRLLGKADSLKMMEPDYNELTSESFYVKTIKEYLEKAN
jgi:hypothetical protein